MVESVKVTDRQNAPLPQEQSISLTSNDKSLRTLFQRSLGGVANTSWSKTWLPGKREMVKMESRRDSLHYPFSQSRQSTKSVHLSQVPAEYVKTFCGEHPSSPQRDSAGNVLGRERIYSSAKYATSLWINPLMEWVLRMLETI